MASYHNKDVAETNVSKWLEIRKSIKNHQKKITELKSAQKVVETEIISSMKCNDIPKYELNQGSLELITKKSKQSVTPKWTKERLTKCLGVSDTLEAKQMIKNIMTEIDNRPFKEKESLVYKDN